PALYEDCLERILFEVWDRDEAAQAGLSLAEVLFWLSAVSGTLLDQLAGTSGTDRSHVLSTVLRSVSTPPLPGGHD
ncbi:hypothetical protein, partial [Streptomyces sp. NPDC058548]